MDKIKKLFQKLRKREADYLRDIIKSLISKEKGLNIKKLQGFDFYRLRKGKFRFLNIY